MNYIQERVLTVITNGLSMNKEDVTIDKTFDELNADSLDIVELIMAFEEEFDIEIPDEIAESLTTVQAVVDYVSEHTS
jgi:acyl carrier protein